MRTKGSRYLELREARRQQERECQWEQPGANEKKSSIKTQYKCRPVSSRTGNITLATEITWPTF